MAEPCVICLDALGESVYRLDCTHTFHRPCIQEWFHTQLQQHLPLTCPTCRRTTPEQGRRPSAEQTRRSDASPLFSAEQTRRLIMDGIVSLPLLLEWTYSSASSQRLRRVLARLNPQLLQFQRDPTYSVWRIVALVGLELALDNGG